MILCSIIVVVMVLLLLLLLLLLLIIIIIIVVVVVVTVTAVAVVAVVMVVALMVRRRFSVRILKKVKCLELQRNSDIAGKLSPYTSDYQQEIVNCNNGLCLNEGKLYVVEQMKMRRIRKENRK
jgi:membrane protein implicated in regulation of membrane protease activity